MNCNCEGGLDHQYGCSYLTARLIEVLKIEYVNTPPIEYIEIDEACNVPDCQSCNGELDAEKPAP